MKFSEFKTLFFKSSNKAQLFATIKNNLNFEELKKFVERFNKELASHKTLLKNNLLGTFNLPKSYKDLNRGIAQYNTRSLKNELAWQAIGFLEESSLIIKFIELRSIFENKLLIGDYSAARQVLDDIESQICISFWSIENRFIIDEYEFGSEKNWATRNLIIAEENENDVRILGDFYSVKCESKYAFYQFNEHCRTWENYVAQSVNLNEGLGDYFRFKANFLLDDNYDNLSFLIYRESRSSLIDRYIMFIRVVHNYITNDSETSNFLLEILNDLYKVVGDRDILNALTVLTQDLSTEIKQDGKIIEALDLYSRGRYEEARTILSSLIMDEPAEHFELLIIYNKCLIESNSPYIPLTEEKTIINNISSLFYEILSKNLNTDKPYFDLIKISYVFNNTHIGLKSYSFIKEQLGWRTHVDFSFLSHLSSKFINPITCNDIYDHQNYLDNFLFNLDQVYDNSVTIELYKNLYNYHSSDVVNFKGIPITKALLYKARTLIIEEKNTEALNLYNELLQNHELSIITKHEILSNCYMCYLKLGDYHQCLKIFVRAYLEKSHLARKMDEDFLLDQIIAGKFRNINLDESLIELPIFFKINSKETLRIKQAYEKFLISNNCKTPSEFITKIKDTEKTKLIYFLKNVCSPEIMMLSRYLSSTYNVNVERIKICQFLATIDGQNVLQYNAEIALITQKNAISKVIGRIDEGKIYVNDEKLKNLFLTSDTRSEVSKINKASGDKKLSKEFFMRTIELQQFTKNNEYKQLNFIFAQLDQSGNVTFGKNPVFSALKQMFLEIRDNFIDNNEYGLNPYLSTRIRHGTLPNHIRSVFERLNLVTAQNEGQYAENDFWKERLQFDQTTNDNIQRFLADFSKNIDETSAILKDELIQCKTEIKIDKPLGLFDFSYINDTDLLELYVTEFSDYEEFIDFSFSELWSRTEKCLKIIQNRLNTETKAKFTSLITDLEQKLEENFAGYEIYGLKNNVNLARTEIQTLLSNVAKWFQRAESSFDGEYQLSMLTETSIQITKNINPNYNFEIKSEVDSSIFFKGEFHQHIIEIIRNFLQNMIKGSKLAIVELEPELLFIEEDGKLKMTYINNVSAAVSEKTLMEKLNAIRDNWSKSDPNVGEEDGTGFPKIKRILHSDLDRRDTNFEYDFDNFRLTLIITFETKGLKI